MILIIISAVVLYSDLLCY